MYMVGKPLYVRRHALRLLHQRRHLMQAETFYDSQSGRTVVMPTGVQCHVHLRTLPIDRISSALAHLLKNGRPVKGLCTVERPDVRIYSPSDVNASVEAGLVSTCIDVAKLSEATAAVTAAREAGLHTTAILSSGACQEVHDIQLVAAELGDAGADAILLTVPAHLDEEQLREAAEMAWEIDLLGVPMRSRLGLCVTPGPQALKLMQYAHKELDMLHFKACIAGREASRPSDLLRALGIKPADANFGSLFLAEHVPDAA